jgi:hypothetical protein
MIKVLKTICGLSIVGIVMMLMMSMDKPIIKKLSTYRGDHFPGFAEFRVQEIEWDDFDNMMLRGEPYDVLLNVNFITSAYRYEDAKKTDHSTIMFTNYSTPAILVRQPYKDVTSSIRRAMEGQIK